MIDASATAATEPAQGGAERLREAKKFDTQGVGALKLEGVGLGVAPVNFGLQPGPREIAVSLKRENLYLCGAEFELSVE